LQQKGKIMQFLAENWQSIMTAINTIGLALISIFYKGGK